MGADKVLTERAGAATAALLGRRALAADAVAEHDAPTDSELEEPQHDEEPLTPVRFVAAAELPEWDAFAPRKPFSQAGLGGMRNDRTPLNTPYTPQLVKLHLKRHDEFDERDEDGPPPGALRRVVAAIRSKVAVVAHPVRRIRFMVDRTVTLVVPQRIQHTRIFARTRGWIVSYLTTVICVPMVWLCSPMLIALVIFTSPVWCAGVAALLIRQMTLDASRHAALSADYSHSSDQSTTEDDHDEPSPHPLTSIYNHIDYNRSH